MADLKTKPSDQSVLNFLEAVPDEPKRQDSLALLEMMRQATRSEPKLWGSSIIGFGDYHYQYASGHSGDTFVVGFSPRKTSFTLYLSTNLEQHRELLDKLGKHKLGKGCLYINKLSDVDESVLRQILQQVAGEHQARPE